jgi:hypothetical protein
MLHTHMLSPVKFQQDISGNPRYSKLAGAIDFPLLRLLNKLRYIDRDDVETASEKQWNAKFGPKFSYNMICTGNKLGDKTFPPKLFIPLIWHHRTFRYTPAAPFSFDLVQAVRRQINFAQKITALYPYDPVPDPILLGSQERYAKFMNLIRLNAVSMPVPAMDIDLFWHTHQLSSSNYLPWCTRHVGRPINHDDTTPETELSTGSDETIDAWGVHYSEDYIIPAPTQHSIQNPPTTVQQNGPPINFEEHIPEGQRLPFSNPPPGTFPGPTTANTTPPPGLTPAQLNLWKFDVARQAEQEEVCRKLFLQNQNEIASVEQELIALNNRPHVAPAKLNVSSKTAFLGSLLKAAAKGVVDGTAGDSQKIRQLEMRRQSALRQHSIRFAKGPVPNQRREQWGRQRWPLLCAARGWGDPKVTHGKWKRPPQGTMELPFPVYAATWYDNVGLYYYNYLTGRGIEGGGMRIGGGMCGAVFDGGNCKAIPEPVMSSCGSGG